MKCLECELDFNPKFSDTHDERFCSKWHERDYCNREYGKSVEAGQVIIGDTLASKKRAGDVKVLSGGVGSEANIANDAVMMRHIMNGNASDKGLKRDVTAMNKEINDKKRFEARQQQRQKIDTMKERYKARWGVSA